jgi:hypothetical protein
MSALMLLSLVPTAGIVIGAIRGLRDRCLRFATVCLGIYLLASGDLYLVVPVYSTAKATYLLGLTPVLAVLFAAGVARAVSRRAGRRCQGRFRCISPSPGFFFKPVAKIDLI